MPVTRRIKLKLEEKESEEQAQEIPNEVTSQSSAQLGGSHTVFNLVLSQSLRGNKSSHPKACHKEAQTGCRPLKQILPRSSNVQIFHLKSQLCPFRIVLTTNRPCEPLWTLAGRAVLESQSGTHCIIHSSFS